MDKLILLGLAALVLAAIHARVWPVRACPACRGTGEQRSGSALRVCRRCGGRKRIKRLLAPRG